MLASRRRVRAAFGYFTGAREWTRFNEGETFREENISQHNADSPLLASGFQPYSKGHSRMSGGGRGLGVLREKIREIVVD